MSAKFNFSITKYCLLQKQMSWIKLLAIADILTSVFLAAIFLLNELLGIMFNIPILNYERILFIGIAAISIMTFILLIKLAKRCRHFRFFAYIALSIALCFVMLINYTFYIFSSSKYKSKWYDEAIIVFRYNMVYTAEQLDAYQRINPFFIKLLGDVPYENTVSQDTTVSDGKFIYTAEYSNNEKETVSYDLY